MYGRDEPSDQLLASCYRKALELAEQHGIARIGFPAISTGVFNYPLAEAAQVALRTIRDAAPTQEAVSLVRFVLFSDADLAVFDRALKEL